MSNMRTRTGIDIQDSLAPPMIIFHPVFSLLHKHCDLKVFRVLQHVHVPPYTAQFSLIALMLFKPYQFIPVANCNKRCRIITVFLSLSVISTLITITTALHFYLSLPTLPHTRGYENSPYIYAPRWTWGLFELFTGQPDPDFYPPTWFPKLLAAPPMQTWDTPSLPEGDALILLHIFSTGSPASRQRRELIRQNSPLDTIPPAYRQFVELEFILGRPKPGTETDEEVIQEEAEIEREIEKYGDIERLNGLMDGDNMNQGKSWDWSRWVGSRQGRKAQWVMKCDDDVSQELSQRRLKVTHDQTFPVLPNLIDTLLGLNPTQPTYFGTSMEHWTGAHHYFEGMMYGFSWNVIKTLSAAKRNELAIHSQEHEDMHMGELMVS